MATNVNIDTCSFIREIRTIVEQSGLAGDVHVVPSIQEWCQENGVTEDSPWRAGKIVRSNENGRYLILLAEQITPEMASSAISALEFRGFVADAGVLSDPQAFVRHLVLHEIAHGLDGTRSEAACDAWAFQQLRKLSANAVQTDGTKLNCN